jgi:D-alanyl-D-alanine carboxypeptidase
MRFLALMATVLLLGACSGRQEFVSGALPQGEPAVDLPAVEPALPALHVQLTRPVSDGVLERAEGARDVVVAAPISVERVPVTSTSTRRSLRVVAVDPLAFRSVAPESTRSADFVWAALLGGRAVLTSEAAGDLNIGGSGTVKVKKSEITVGAFADNGVPNFGDVMISSGLGRDARLERANEFVVGAEEGVDLDALRSALRKRIDGIEKIDLLQPRPAETPPPPDPVGTAEGDLIGAMNFRVLDDGTIQPDPAWVATNIAQGSVPILGSVTCHRILFPQLGAALAEIENEGLARAISVRDFGGCYVPRFIDRDPRRGLSMHAFGLALDLNVSRNYLGTKGDMHPDVVAIFEEWGFEWGGRWSRPDPMHFELDRLVEP